MILRILGSDQPARTIAAVMFGNSPIVRMPSGLMISPNLVSSHALPLSWVIYSKNAGDWPCVKSMPGEGIGCADRCARRVRGGSADATNTFNLSFTAGDKSMMQATIVPVPAAAWLMGPTLLMLLRSGRKQPRLV